MAKMKQKILNVEEGIEDGFENNLQMKAEEHLYYIVRTEMNDVRNRAKSY